MILLYVLHAPLVGNDGTARSEVLALPHLVGPASVGCAYLDLVRVFGAVFHLQEVAAPWSAQPGC
jgi:hypothetical protein